MKTGNPKSPTFIFSCLIGPTENTHKLHADMDQSTQVNFTVTRENPHKLRRQQTTSFITHVECSRRPTSNMRPKSINLAAEVYNKGKFYSSDSTVSGYKSASNSDVILTNVSYVKERGTSHPQQFPNAGSLNDFKGAYCKVRTVNQDTVGSTSANHCRCWEYERHSNAGSYVDLSPTPEGLSWRRLHMSRAKLKATATTSELLSGFAMVAMVELQINEPTLVPDWLFVMFSVCTTVLVSVHIFALMISTYILPNIEAVAKMNICEIVGESPHERMRYFIELAWVFSTGFGLFLFLVEVAILCWVKFWDTSFTAAIAATVVVIPVLVIFILFAVHFYHSLVVHRYDTSVNDMVKLEDMKKHLDQVNLHV